MAGSVPEASHCLLAGPVEGQSGSSNTSASAGISGTCESLMSVCWIYDAVWLVAMHAVYIRRRHICHLLWPRPLAQMHACDPAVHHWILSASTLHKTVGTAGHTSGAHLYSRPHPVPVSTSHWTHLLVVQQLLQLLKAVLLLVACLFMGLLLQPPETHTHAGKAPHIRRTNCIQRWWICVLQACMQSTHQHHQAGTGDPVQP